MSQDKKDPKDLTSLVDFAKALEESGHAPPAPAGSVFEEQQVDQINNFETLDEYGKTNPAPEPPALEISSEPPALEISMEPQAPTSDFPTTADSAEPGSPSGMDFSDAAPIELDAPPPDSGDPAERVIAPQFTNPDLQHEEREDLAEPLRPAQNPASTGISMSSLQKVKHYSEQLTPGKDAVPASFPFSLLITGHLAPEEKARLLDLLSRENMGIREMDLEPQFESGKILIPRISEYAGVLIVGALRSTSAKMRLGPSDTIFATADTQDTHSDNFDHGERQSSSVSSESNHPAEDIPVTTEDSIPNLPRFIVIDVVTASAAIRSHSVETAKTPEYQEMLEALQREIKYKAYRKGATAILNFNVQLTSLNMPSQYRILVTGSAVKAL